MKKIIIILLLVVSILMAVFAASASELKINNLRTKEEAVQYIESYVNDIEFETKNIQSMDERTTDDMMYSIENEYKLYSFSNNKNYLLCLLSPKGYVVYDEISGVIEEINLNGDCPYDFSQKGKFYYGGPLNYIVENNGVYRDISSSCIITDEQIAGIKINENKTVLTRKATRALPTRTEQRYMQSSNFISSLSDGDYAPNNNGICGQVACQIMLLFYDANVDSNYIPSNMSDPIVHMNYLINFMGNGGSTVLSLYNGLTAYFQAINFDEPRVAYQRGNSENVFWNVYDNVLDNRPTVILMFNNDDNTCPMNHTVVAYGYRAEYSGSIMTSAMYYVHTGWGTNNSCNIFMGLVLR